MQHHQFFLSQYIFNLKSTFETKKLFLSLLYLLEKNYFGQDWSSIRLDRLSMEPNFLLSFICYTKSERDQNICHQQKLYNEPSQGIVKNVFVFCKLR